MSSAVAIGVFDGVHLGHQELLHRTVDVARELNLSPSVLTFDPHPACVVNPARAPKLLMTIEERCRLIREYGIGEIVILPFDQKIADLQPAQFAEQILRERMHARAVIVGENFGFGRERAGTAQTLEELGFITRPLPPVKYKGVVVSASEIRSAIALGDVEGAAAMLGRPFCLSGEIVSGHGIGSKKTVPTLNLRPIQKVQPKGGVYITRTMDLDNGRSWKSITNIGTRPTFEDTTEVSYETFLLDPFSEPTPAHIQVDFLKRVRDERKFESPDELRSQIMKDVEAARKFFRKVH